MKFRYHFYITDLSDDTVLCVKGFTNESDVCTDFYKEYNIYKKENICNVQFLVVDFETQKIAFNKSL